MRLVRDKFKLWAVSLICLMACGLSMTSCSDEIDDSNMYTFKGEMVLSYLNSRAEFSDYVNMLKSVRLSSKSESTIANLLSARGHYTVFAPTNDALHTYVDSIMGQVNYDLSQLADSIMVAIVKNSLIDNGDDEAYKTTDFNVEGALSQTNMNDRYITISFDTYNGKGVVVINAVSKVIEPDLEVTNGVIHVVDRVVSSSMSTLPSLLEQTTNTRVFARLLKETGWADSMVMYLDNAYEEDHPETVPNYDSGGAPLNTPEHRKYGFTAFVESDDLLKDVWGLNPTVDPINGTITNWEEVVAIIKEKCESMSLYKKRQDASTSNDAATNLRNPDNVINQFVAYHLLEQAIPFNKLVIHHNELGYAYNKPEVLTLNCTNYYETFGKYRRLMRITEGADTKGGKYINRRSTYDNGMTGTYKEMIVLDPGTLVNGLNGTLPNNALNGSYFLIDRVLEYDAAIESALANERMRFDVLDFLPEISSNNIRRPNSAVKVGLPKGYLKYLTPSDETNMAYLTEWAPASWRDYMGDELCISGQYDFVYRLPAVPVTGTYELRMASSNNPLRGMAQIYLGTNKENLQAIGLPVDLRLKGVNPLVGWEADTEDEVYNLSVDKAMRNHNYMKAPNFTGLTSGSGVTTSLRAVDGSGNSVVRRIITTQTFRADQVYYIRFKSVLESKYTQFFFDYLELVPKAVIAQGEDIW